MAPRPVVIAGCWLAAAAALAVLSVAAHHAGPLPGDERITDAVQRVPGLELPSRVVRALTGTQLVLVLGALCVIALWLARLRREAVALGIALLILPFAQAGLKEIVDRPRPDPALVDRRTGFSSESFPSGHVMSGTLLYGYLLVLLLATGDPRQAPWTRVAAALLALLLLGNLFANVYMGVHWPTDVLGGMLGALLLLLPAVAVAPALWGRRAHAREAPSSVAAPGE